MAGSAGRLRDPDDAISRKQKQDDDAAYHDFRKHEYADGFAASNYSVDRFPSTAGEADGRGGGHPSSSEKYRPWKPNGTACGSGARARSVSVSASKTRSIDRPRFVSSAGASTTPVERLSAGVRLRVSAPELSGVASENADGLWRKDRFDSPER